MITAKQYLMGRDKLYPLTVELASNMADLLSRVNYLFGRLNLTAPVSSGYRPPEINYLVQGAAKTSQHTLCKAIDVVDQYGKIGLLLSKRTDLLESCGLWLENPNFTKKLIAGKQQCWSHLDTKERKNRIFDP